MAKSKVGSTYRTAWQSAKKNVDPQALKKCNFSKGLGPMIDKYDQAWEAIVDLETKKEEVPAKTIKAFEKTIQKTQAIIQKYFQQVVSGNRSHPELGESWKVLHNALMRVDRMLIGDVKDGIESKVTCAKMNGWLDKKDFKKPSLQPEKETEPDDSEAWNKLIKKVAGKKNDPEQAVKQLSKGAGTCFPYSRDNTKKLADLANYLLRQIKQIRFEIEKDEPDCVKARSLLTQTLDRSTTWAKQFKKPGDNILIMGLSRNVFNTLARQIKTVEK